MIKVSAGTAHVLGIKKLATDAPPTTAYMMSGERCSHNCRFCPQSRTASSSADLLSRVTWIKGDENHVSERIHRAFEQGQMKRACLQVVDGADSLLNSIKIIRQLKDKSEIPICVSTRAGNPEELFALIDAGAERIGISLDAASERVYNTTKTGSWQETLTILKMAADLLPGRISTHLIVGLGETEQEMAEALQMMYDLKVTVGLFAFTPVAGTGMADVKPPVLEQYRRMQTAAYLIGNGMIDYSRFCFDNGRLISYGLSHAELKKFLADGRAFQTSGCPDCNRPYYNERPGGVIYNYPRPLTSEECHAAAELICQSVDQGVS